MGLDTFETQALQILSEGRLHDDTLQRLADRLSTDAIAIASLQTLADELRRDKERLDWLLVALRKGWSLFIVKNPHTGTFLCGERDRGFIDGVERREDKRLGRGPRGDDGRQAIDRAREGEGKHDAQG